MLVGVNARDTPEQVAAGIERYGVTWTVALQAMSLPICDQYKVGAFPTYVVLDRDGKVRARTNSGVQVDGIVEALLKEGQTD